MTAHDHPDRPWHEAAAALATLADLYPEDDELAGVLDRFDALAGARINHAHGIIRSTAPGWRIMGDACEHTTRTDSRAQEIIRRHEARGDATVTDPAALADLWCNECERTTLAYALDGADDWTCPECGLRIVCTECGASIDRAGTCTRPWDER